MASFASDPADVIVGVDPHQDQHVAVALDGLGRRLGERFVSAAPGGYADLLAWAASLGRVAAFGVEGTGSYGLGLARFLRRMGSWCWRSPVRPARASGAGRARATQSTPSTPPASSSRVPAR